MKSLAGFDKMTSVNGIKTHYYDTEKGQPLVLIHGGGAGTGAAVTWPYNIPELAKDFRVVAPDYLGHGLTDMPSDSDCSMTAIAEHIVGLLVQLHITNAFVLGWARGAWVASYIAIKYPAMVKKLILVNTGSIDSTTPFHLSQHLTRGDYTISDVKKSNESWTCRLDLITQEMDDLKLEYGKRNLETTRRADELNESSTMAKLVNTSIDGKHISELLSKITSPTLIIWSTLNTTPVELGVSKILMAIKGSQMHIFNDAKHTVFIDQHEEFNTLVKFFCKKNT